MAQNYWVAQNCFFPKINYKWIFLKACSCEIEFTQKCILSVSKFVWIEPRITQYLFFFYFRQYWFDYFTSINTKVIFWSALQETEVSSVKVSEAALIESFFWVFFSKYRKKTLLKNDFDQSISLEVKW